MANNLARYALVCILAAASGGCYPDSTGVGYYGAADDADAESPTAAAAPVTPSGAGAAQTGASKPDGDGGGRPEAGASDAGPTTTVGCDLGGRWIATDREVATAVGAEEAAHTWFYFELSQAGDDGTVGKGLDCGQDVRGISSVSADVDYEKTWPAMLAKDLQTGRKFTSAMTGGGCAVSFAKSYQVVGATLPFFEDPSQTMPTVSQQATPTAPGWEDWDDDGHPGFTMNVTGLATGQIYIAVRSWTIWSGTIATGASTFQLADDWGSEQDLLGYSGSSLLTQTASGTRDSDASLHFVVFARLGPTQATGDDATICAAIRSLAPSMTSSAAN